MRNIFFLLLLISEMGLSQQKTIGRIIALDPAFHHLVDTASQIEVLAEGFGWSEGPVWIRDSNYIIFSDVKRNTIYKWKEGEGLSEFLKPSGYTGRLPYSNEPGSNGLTINNQGHLVLCEHGDRRISVMPLSNGGKRTLADNYKGKKFNSPNDIAQKSNGDYYFTDPSYGLPKDSLVNVKIKGVYRIAGNGTVTLLISDLPAPNGIAFSPDEKTLYVAQSHPEKAYIMAYPVRADGTLGKGKVFYDATPLGKSGLRGSPDGLKTDLKGNIFTTGPGGVLVISPSGKLLGRIETDELTANCGWGDDGSTLYLTVNMMLCRVKTKTKGKLP